MISKFYGIVIRMWFIRPFVAHFHAFYGDCDLGFAHEVLARALEANPSLAVDTEKSTSSFLSVAATARQKARPSAFDRKTSK